MSTALLSTTYFGPIQWYQKLNRYDTCLIEQHDHFLKQTYRNRCVIATTQGLQALTVPIESPQGQRIDKTEVKDVRISDHGDWRHLHWQALQSAYGESPFLSSMPMTSIRSLKNGGNIFSTSTWPSRRRCAS